MRVFIKNLAVHRLLPAFMLLALATLNVACGNKGDLFLNTGDLRFESVPPIEDALDELEVMEAEEAIPSEDKDDPENGETSEEEESS